MSTLLNAQRLTAAIGGRTVCRDLDLRIDTAQSWALLGRNGAGKTTLLHTLAGLRPAASGAVLIGERRIEELRPRARAQRIGVLLQHSARGFGSRVIEHVLGGRHPHLGALQWEAADDLAIARDALAAADCADLAGRDVDTLSGGEMRRVEIARLLAQQAPLNLLDEPLNHLDPGHQATMLQALDTHCVTPARALLMVVHDLDVAWHACSHWLLLDGDGGWRAGSREQMADPAALSMAFGHPIDRIDSARGTLFRTRL